jgi:lipopolysaccharide transport system ATP-binding protein
MSRPIIAVENLSKKYIIGRKSNNNEGLRHVLERIARTPLAILKEKKLFRKHHKEEFWAIKNISLNINQGEMIGVIGRNGAGKSTLLKLLSRITEPTTGRITLRGRVASLLEVGTGFHPELTGRENIYLNGAILGMSRAEIKRKFDEIIAFAEIDTFLDTPVKRYSSGMYVRLAFAVAAHLEPDILIVDEVLAVGDSAFQKKCLGKMENATLKEGRTVLLVSHQMPAIQNLCKRCILMDQGSIVCEGNTSEVVKKYMSKSEKLANDLPLFRLDRSGIGDIVVTSISFKDEMGDEICEAITGMSLIISIEYETKNGKLLKDCIFCLEIHKELKKFFALSSELTDRKKIQVNGNGKIEFIIPDWPLSAGRYYIDTYVESEKVMQDRLQDAAYIDVINGDFYGSGKVIHEDWQGSSVLVKHSWIIDSN